jgi:phosphoglycolate phosphatase-like HAD superfamily hydrolase
MKVCLFDIDGTLIRTGGAGKQAFEAALNEEFGIHSSNGDVAFSGRTDRAIVRDLFTLHKINDSPESWQRFRASYLRLLPERLASNNGEVLPGIESILQDLVQRSDVAVGLLTGNIAAGAELKLAHFGLYGHFQFGGFGDEHTDRDSVAEEALAAARRSVDERLDARDVFVIGDTPLDVRCARAIGANAVAVCTGFCTKQDLIAARPDLLIDDLRTSSPLLDLMFARP